jgi:hypothetical protein
MNSNIPSRVSPEALIPFASPHRWASEEYLVLPQIENMCGIESRSASSQSSILKVEIILLYLGF